MSDKAACKPFLQGLQAAFVLDCDCFSLQTVFVHQDGLQIGFVLVADCLIADVSAVALHVPGLGVVLHGQGEGFADDTLF